MRCLFLCVRASSPCASGPCADSCAVDALAVHITGVRKVCMYALRWIDRGEELCLDYGPDFGKSWEDR